MSIPFSKRISISDDTLRRELDGESVILSLNRETYFGVDAVGTHILSVLLTSESIEQAYAKLLSEYDVDAERLREDLEQFVKELVEHGLVRITGD